MVMLNNKGFAVSTILYTILIAFLLFLGITLSMFSSSNSIISNANNDLVNGTVFRAVQVRNNNQPKENCISINVQEPEEGQYYWYQMDNNILIKITSRYGVIYWPRDFIKSDEIIITEDDILPGENIEDFKNLSNDKKFFYKYLRYAYIDLTKLNKTYNNISYEIRDYQITDSMILSPFNFDITFEDIKSGATTTLTVSDICS